MNSKKHRRNWIITYYQDGEPLSPQWDAYTYNKPTLWAKKNCKPGQTFTIEPVPEPEMVLTMQPAQEHHDRN